MAAPSSKSLTNLSGTWKLNKSLSSDYTQILTFQGVSTLTAKAIGTASVTLKIAQVGLTHIEVEQSATAAGISGTTEQYDLDWTWRGSKDAFFGGMSGRSRWVKKNDIGNGEVGGTDEDGAFLKGGMGDGEEVVQALSRKRDGSWTAEHVWGVEDVEGGRRYTRRVIVRNKEGETKRVRMVYDWQGEN
ncbi:MAG: hypothetical protein Q9160_008921 [Pyrenula sp. 1 TL-2023]